MRIPILRRVKTKFPARRVAEGEHHTQVRRSSRYHVDGALLQSGPLLPPGASGHCPKNGKGVIVGVASLAEKGHRQAQFLLRSGYQESVHQCALSRVEAAPRRRLRELLLPNERPRAMESFGLDLAVAVREAGWLTAGLVIFAVL